MSLPAHSDVAVIGGGIQGAGVAQAAAAAGYFVLLVEQRELAAGTSSKSSKLIHGGLRYLQQAQFGLVRESLRERDILCRIAPHLVGLNDFYIPVYHETRLRPWQLRIGLSLYAALGLLGKAHRFDTLPSAEWSHLDGLDTDGLKRVFRYRDGQTDDAALTRAVAASARELGATIACPARFEGARRTPEGYRMRVGFENGAEELDCSVLINATGPWVDGTSQLVEPTPPTFPVDLVQGSHLVLEPALGERCYYLEAPGDHRAVFALPWHGRTLLGTTETLYHGDPARAHILPEEEAYLLQVLEHYFPDYPRAPNFAVTERMTGLRVLPRRKANPFKRSREVMFATAMDSDSGYIGVYGGKLTGYRATAQKIMKLVARALGPRAALADTAELPLPEA